MKAVQCHPNVANKCVLPFWRMGRAYALSSQDSLQIKVEGIFGEEWWMVKRCGPEINF